MVWSGWLNCEMTWSDTGACMGVSGGVWFNWKCVWLVSPATKIWYHKMTKQASAVRIFLNPAWDIVARMFRLFYKIILDDWQSSAPEYWAWVCHWTPSWSWAGCWIRGLGLVFLAAPMPQRSFIRYFKRKILYFGCVYMFMVIPLRKWT